MFDFSKLNIPQDIIDNGNKILEIVQDRVTKVFNDDELIEAVETQLDSIESFVESSLDKALDYLESVFPEETLDKVPDFMAQFRP